MIYDDWERIDSMDLPWDFYDKLSYIREDAECQNFKNDFETDEYVVKIFSRDFSEVWERINYDDISTEYHEHELCDDEIEPTYAVYIYVNENFRNIVENLYPEYFI